MIMRASGILHLDQPQPPGLLIKNLRSYPSDSSSHAHILFEMFSRTAIWIIPNLQKVFHCKRV